MVQQTNTAARRWFWLPLLLGVGLFLGLAYITQWPAAITAVDVNQHRANTAIIAPQGNRQISQTLVPQWDGLSEIELLLVRYREADTDGTFTLRLLDDAGRLIAERRLETLELRHNQTFAFRFPPQRQSAGRQYTLVLTGNESNPISVWGYDIDVYGAGELAISGEESLAQDLRFVTRYQLQFTTALGKLWATLHREGILILLALLFLFMPGCLVLHLPGPEWTHRWDPAAWWGVALALSVSIWPILWFWLTLLGGRWAGWSLWIVLAIGWGVVLWQMKRTFALRASLSSRRLHHTLLLLLLLLGLAVRLLAVRHLAFPAWVDASRHALITTIMAESGQTIRSYEPLLPIDRFPYHFGFHTLSASLSLLTDWPLPQLLLTLGQLLNALVPLTVYAAGWLLTRRPGVGLLAAFLVALPFFFPAYYATWGRLTQLAAMLLMPILLALTWTLVYGGRRWRDAWWLVGLLAAGVFLIHFRVFLLYIPFATLLWLFSLATHLRQSRSADWRGWWLPAAAALALMLVGPQLFQLIMATDPVRAVSHSIPGYNVFPTSYLAVGWERHFLWLAAACFFFVLLAWLKRQRWTSFPLFLVIWVALLFLLLIGEPLGLPESSLINLNSMYITLFLPLALFLAISLYWLWRWLAWQHWLIQLLSYTAAGAALSAAFLFGIRQQVTILNPQTILAEPPDLMALQWLDERLPDEAKVAVSSWRWLGNAWAGSDGGAWILPLTGRGSTTPPADYTYSRPLIEAVSTFNEEAIKISDWSDPATADWLRQHGVTHIYVGARGGFFDPSALVRNPQVELLYHQEGVFIFALR